MRFNGQVWFALSQRRWWWWWWSGAGGEHGSWVFKKKGFTQSNFQPLCPTTDLVNLFSTSLGELPSLISGGVRCRRAKSTPTGCWPQTEKPPRSAACRGDKLQKKGGGGELDVRAKLIIQVQFSVSAEVVELCHAGSENTGRTVGPAVGGAWWGPPSQCRFNKRRSYCSAHFGSCTS